ncbi:MAG: family 43 glycosylhydrolase, partial [Clostridiales bacterium]|nr:family 43 glycosylhydrolase [Clostridiales bacterium]
MIIENGKKWHDADGIVLHAHGGFMLKENGMYYWYGENRLDNVYVSCYASTDLARWEFRNHVLFTESKTEKTRVRANLDLRNEKGGKINLERPKVLYNSEIKKYVLWAHYENGENYGAAAAAVATCDSPDGDFTYHGSFNPFGEMSRDCTLFKDDSGDAYFISAARDNADMHVYRLQSDYLNVGSLVSRLWPGEYREAPAVARRGGVCYMLSSFCTGWAPNQCKYATAKSIEGRFSRLIEIGDKTTYGSQPAFILEISGTEATSFLYVGDRWDANDYFNSTYVFLPLEFREDGTPELKYYPRIDIDT